MESEAFLNLYRTLEELLAEKYRNAGKQTGNPVMRFIGAPESAPFRDGLNACREVRNLLSHHPEWNGEPLVMPSDALGAELSRVIAYLQKPPLAREYATLTRDILIAHQEDLVLPLMRRMEQRGYSHVPVAENGRMIGVFSVGTAFRYLLHGGQVNEKTPVSAFRELLPVERHTGEGYLFLPFDATCWEVRECFERRGKRNQRLAAVFLTEHGDPHERLLGMLTPWDVLGE